MIAATAALLLVGAPWAHRGLLMGALIAPVPTAVGLLALVARSAFVEARRSEADPAVGAVISAAAELRAGAPLRSVMASGVFGPGVAAAARAGRSFDELPISEFERFGPDAPMVAATIELAVRDGGPAADLLDALAASMLDAGRTRRERRAAMAPAVLQAVVVGGAPALMVGQMAVSGRMVDLLSAGGWQAATAIGGLAATAIGILAIVGMILRGVR